MRVHLLLGCLGTVAWVSTAHAFEEDTHEVLTQAAAIRSVLQTAPNVLGDLGLTGSITDLAQTFPDSKDDPRTIRRLMEIGSRFEDNVRFLPPPIEARIVNHFYNPLTGDGYRAGVIRGTASPAWALAPRGSNRDQQFSYWDARQYFYDGLTKGTKAERERNLGLTFQTIGHVLHHLQDMAQPQHVRNDQHCKFFACIFLLMDRARVN